MSRTMVMAMAMATTKIKLWEAGRRERGGGYELGKVGGMWGMWET